MTSDSLTSARMNPEGVRAFFDAHWTVRQYKALDIPPEHLDVMLHAAQRAPTDATAQMYSFVRLVDAKLRKEVAALTANPQFASAGAAFVVCADVRRLRQLLEARGHLFGDWPAASVHFGLGDAVLAGQNFLLAAELLGYRGCWIGGVQSALPRIVELLELPPGVLPFAGLTVGVPDELPTHRPRLGRALIVHQDRYRDPNPEELEQALADMAGITARGDWARTLARYFARGGTMEKREPLLREVLARQGFSHAADLDELMAQAEAAGFDDVRVRRIAGGFEAWLDGKTVAHRGEGDTPTGALGAAIREAERAADKAPSRPGAERSTPHEDRF